LRNLIFIITFKGLTGTTRWWLNSVIVLINRKLCDNWIYDVNQNVQLCEQSETKNNSELLQPIIY